MFWSVPQVWKHSYRRIFLMWALVLFVGFLGSGIDPYFGYLHWFPLIIVGLFFQIYKQPVHLPKPRLLLIMWAFVSFAGTLYNALVYYSLVSYPTLIPNWAMFWLALLSFPQIITGFIFKSVFQKVIGVLWLIIAVALWQNTFDQFTSFLIVALLTSIPYFFIAFYQKQL